jgi:alpha-ribazole phosphatase
MKIVLVRHPPARVAPGICYGRLDLQLRDGIGALAADPAFIGITRVWTSPARRCRELALAISGEAISDPRLLELDFGAWEGRPWDEVPRVLLDEWAAAPLEFAPPGGESGAALVARVGSFHDDLMRAGEDCIVISHGGPLKVLSALLAGRPVDPLAPAPALGSVSMVVC